MTILDQSSGAEHPLDSPVWSSLTGPHAHLAESSARARRYSPDVAAFGALHPDLDDDSWAELSALVGRGGEVTLAGPPGAGERRPTGWQVMRQQPTVQMIATEALVSRPDPEAVRLGAEDVADILDLVRRTESGPFLPRTHRMGTYLGFRSHGRLIAMAGERLHPPGWTEISAVCTDPDYRGKGLAERLIRAVAEGIRQRDENPFLHAAAHNATAIRLYERIGFTVRLRTDRFFLRVP
ncbi:MAG TPA: GNAT family N-acetyltransferase [Kineosporiaceae bacterium]|nr:GNAT family N-acetyltransferase [Kineosporiaceae bacterium]